MTSHYSAVDCCVVHKLYIYRILDLTITSDKYINTLMENQMKTIIDRLISDRLID